MVTAEFRHDQDGTKAADWREHEDWGQVPVLDLEIDDEPARRLVVVAAHPDDESLGAGGLISLAYRAGITTEFVLLTAGEASHPDSPTVSAAEMQRQRMAEMERAVTALAPGSSLIFLDAVDGRVADDEAEVVARLVKAVGDGRRTLLLAPWRGDGHTDHEAAGRAAAVAAWRTGARLVEYPVWLWHREQPTQAPWHQMRRVDLDESARQAKRAAIEAHASQIRPLSAEPGDEVLLSECLLEHFSGPVEHFVVSAAAPDPTLDRLHRGRPDPWGVGVRWYERRKRALTLAALPRERFHRALEIGCSVGVLAEELTTRCDEVVALDSSPGAVEAATARLGVTPGAHVMRMDVPREWPTGRFDLVVVSETGYFLSPHDLDELIERIRECLEPGGVVLLCHWRHPIEGWVLDGPDVHDRFRESELPPEAARYVDRDVEIAVLCEPGDWPDADA